jgi:fimbrial chaperone protein
VPSIRSLSIACLLAACPVHALAGAFGVSPIRVDLDPGSRTGLITVTNDDEAKLYFQLKLFEWKQGATGEDTYAESDDLLYFPQILTIDPKDKRLVRVGLKAPPAGGERAFRLFIEELPDPNAPAAQGAQVAVRVRFGVPIFLSTGKGESQPAFSGVSGAKGAMTVGIVNSGVRQVRFEEVEARSGEKVIAKAAGWYVFPGATRSFTIPVTPQDCPLPASVEFRAVADGKEIRKMLEVPPAVCSP